MKCEEARELLTEYVDEQLPEVTHRRVDHHLAVCASCRSEYDAWTESGEWIRAERESHAEPVLSRSLVDAVMARILSEEKWAIPIGRRMFAVTARMRRWGLGVAALFLVICTISIYSQSGDEWNVSQTVSADKVGVVSATMEPIEPVDPVPVSDQPAGEFVPLDGAKSGGTVQEVAFQAFDSPGETRADQPNYGLILGFFGIVLTVLSMSWFTRA